MSRKNVTNCVHMRFRSLGAGCVLFRDGWWLFCVFRENWSFDLIEFGRNCKLICFPHIKIVIFCDYFYVWVGEMGYEANCVGELFFHTYSSYRLNILLSPRNDYNSDHSKTCKKTNYAFMYTQYTMNNTLMRITTTTMVIVLTEMEFHPNLARHLRRIWYICSIMSTTLWIL